MSIRFLSSTEPNKLIEQPEWLSFAPAFINFYCYEIDTTNQAFEETIEGEFDQPIEIDDLLFGFGFDNIHFLEEDSSTLEFNLA
ncbi:hypothetical protein [Gloeothece verrucosa]|uniref:Uncharacterized protein n=1 Tax=Gloeothece verrucosa (strain PCC 7822) TaxID=497965 RepID=E0UAG5_GLOV7|nr:hypothetical protein [Gloeothece verrucosa]ADN12706.1 hypothetical protein Cyan7822_0670 [Gloeothece verrucosa PCC 7822]